MGPPEASRAVSVGFETAIWHFRSATSCFYWASKLLSGTFSAPLKTLKTFAAAFDGLSLLCHGSSRGPTSCFCWASKLLSGTSEAPQAVSIGLRNCYLARFQLKTFKGFKTFAAACAGLSLLCHGSSRSPTSCFCWLRNCYLALPKRHKLFLFGFETAICWAAKLLSGTSEAPQAVSIGLRNCYLARFQHPLKPTKPSKPSQQLSTAFRCFAMGPPEAPRAVSVGLRNCYLALPKRHKPKLFLLGFETAIWHVFSTP